MDINGTTLSTLTETDLLLQLLGDKRKGLPSVVTLTVVYSLIFITGVIGNVSTCLVIARNTYMHTVTNYYLFSLAVSDTLTLVLGKWFVCLEFTSQYLLLEVFWASLCVC